MKRILGPSLEPELRSSLAYVQAYRFVRTTRRELLEELSVSLALEDLSKVFALIPPKRRRRIVK